jgi:histidine triad (HIT) family protein
MAIDRYCLLIYNREMKMKSDKDQPALFDTGDAESVSEAGTDDSKCAFCAVIRGDESAEKIFETERLVAFLDHRPLFHGHTLLVPKLHVQLLSDLPADRVQEFFLEAQRLERAIETSLEADGSMILINNVISQSVPHLHLHVIPRRNKDGLRFWLGPRHPYTAENPAELYAEKIRAALSNLE